MERIMKYVDSRLFLAIVSLEGINVAIHCLVRQQYLMAIASFMCGIVVAIILILSYIHGIDNAEDYIYLKSAVIIANMLFAVVNIFIVDTYRNYGNWTPLLNTINVIILILGTLIMIYIIRLLRRKKI